MLVMILSSYFLPSKILAVSPPTPVISLRWEVIGVAIGSISIARSKGDAGDRQEEA
jgi:hypothetical protein